MEFRTVEEFISINTLIIISPFDTVKKACEIMTCENTGAVVVVTGDHLVGLLSEKDIVRKCMGKGLDPSTTEVNAVMTTHVQTIDVKSTVSHALSVMAKGNFHHLPVIGNNFKLVGLISSDDIPDECRV